MLVDSELPTPFLPITSLQLQYFQAVAHSFARRRSTIPPVFNNFQTLSVATGVVPSRVSLSVQPRLPVPALHCLAVLPVSAWSVSRTIVRSVPATKRSHQAFLVKNNSECKSCDACHPHSMLYIAIQCTETPFGERFGAIPPTPVD